MDQLMPLFIEGYAIVSEDGMLADDRGVMPAELMVEADQKFLSDELDQASVLVHGRHSHEFQARSPERWRLIATRKVTALAPTPAFPRGLFWNPANVSLEEAAAELGVRDGRAAILGGTEVYGLFLDRYDAFHLSRVAGPRLLHGRPVFPQVPEMTPEHILQTSGLSQASKIVLDSSRIATLSNWMLNKSRNGMTVKAA